MTTRVEFRKYSTILELSFDFERLLGEEIKELFYHFHRDAFSDGSVRPYAIKYTNMANKSKTLLFDDILSMLHYIPTYILSKPIATDFAYITMTNELKVVPKSSQLCYSLVDMYNASSNQETLTNTEPIAESTITNIRDNLTAYNIEFTEDDNFLHIPGDIHISKKLFPSKLPNVIIPKMAVDYDDEYACIGYFMIYNGKNVNRRSDINLALITVCSECGTTLVVNYEQGTKCHSCGAHNQC